MNPLLSCSVTLADTNSHRPPIILIHGSANSASVWSLWQHELGAQGWSTFALDLRGHGQSPSVNLSGVRMADYADDVRKLMRQLKQPPVLMGWSMGGLVAMMAAATEVAACITLAPSIPARQEDPTVTLRPGIMTSEVYGITHTDPADQPSMPDLTIEERRVALAALGPESQYARDERQCGIVIETLPCPLLIVTGTLDSLWPSTRYRDLWLPADHLSMDGASHWGLVLNQRALTAIAPHLITWLEQAL